MKRIRELFSRKNKAKIAEPQDMMSTTRAILKESENTLMQIFDEHRLELLDKDADYIIHSVCGLSQRGCLTKQQIDIHNKVNPAIVKIYEMLKLDKQTVEQEQSIMFIIRLTMVLKMLLMMELFRNRINQRNNLENTRQKELEEMEACGHA